MRPSTLDRAAPWRPLVVLALVVGSWSWAVGDEPARPVTRMIPARDLVAYLEYDGLDAHDAAWKATSAYAMIHRTGAGAMAADVTRQLVDQIRTLDVNNFELSGAELVEVHDRIFRNGFTIACYDDGARFGTIFVLRGWGQKSTRDWIEKKRAEAARDPKQMAPPEPTLSIRGRTVHGDSAPATVEAAPAPSPPPPGGAKPDEPPVAPSPPPGGAKPDEPPVAPSPPPPGDPKLDEPPVAPFPDKPELDANVWWFEGDDLVFVSGPIAAPGEKKPDAKKKDGELVPPRLAVAVFDAIDAKTPNVATHPGRAAALAEGSDIAGFAPNGLFFVETKMDRNKGLMRLLNQATDNKTGDLIGAKNPLGGVDNIPRAVATDIPGTLPPPPAAEARVAAPGPRPSPGMILPAPKEEPAAAKIAERPKFSSTMRTLERELGVEKAAQPQDAAHEAQRMIKAAGIDRVDRIVGRWGFQGRALLTDVRVEAPAPRVGFVSLLDQPKFRLDALPPIPRDAESFAIGAFDPIKSGKTLKTTLTAIDLATAMQAAGMWAEFRLMARLSTGVSLNEVLRQLGPSWCVYLETRPIRGKAPQPIPTLLVGVRDSTAFVKTLDALANKFNGVMRQSQGLTRDEPSALELVKLEPPERGYRLTSPAGLIPWLSDEIEPTILLGKASLVVALNPGLAHKAFLAELDPAARWTADPEVKLAFAAMPAEVTSLVIGDVRNSILPEAICDMPKYVQYGWGLFGGDAAGAGEAGSSSPFLTMIGVPRSGGFRLRLDPKRRPKPAELRAHLFANVSASTVDDRGFRWISRESFPLASVWALPEIKTNAVPIGGGGLPGNIKLSLPFAK